LISCVFFAAIGSSQEPFAIKDSRFIDRSTGSNTNVALEEEGGQLLASAKLPGGADGTLQISNGRIILFGIGATHTLIGKITMFDHVFESDKDDPLRFRVDGSQGYLYLSGKGSVKMPNGDIVRLPKGMDQEPE